MSEETREFRRINIESFHADDVPVLVDDMVEWLREIQEKEVPTEHRARMCLEISACGSDDAYAEVELSYSRLETDEEMASRIAWRKRHEEMDEERERAEYDRLRKKFVGD